MPTKKILPLLVFGILFVSPYFLKAQENAPTVAFQVNLSCLSKGTAVDENQMFPIAKGQGVELSCVLVNSTKEKLTGMLLAKQNANGVISASSTMVNLDEEANQEVTLSFPQLFVPGVYYYSAVLMGNDGKPLSADIVLTGKLEGQQQVSIASATLDKAMYAWDDMVKLSLVLSDHGQGSSIFKAGELTLSVSILDVDQNDCNLLLNEQAVVEVATDYQFKLTAGVHCINAIRVNLIGKDGAVLDQKIIAVPLPAEESIEQKALTDSSTKRTMIVMWGSIVALGVLLAYLWWRYRRTR